MLENAPDLPASVQDCSGRWFEPFAWYDPSAGSWRTWQRCLIEQWETYSDQWPQTGMTRNGIAFRLLTQDRYTVARASGSPLPTPTASSGRTGAIRPFDGGSGARKKARKLLPTPTVHGNYNRQGCSDTSGDGLFTVLTELFGPVTGKPSLRRFVEWMFGYPQDWTELESPPPSRRSATPSSPKSPKPGATLS